MKLGSFVLIAKNSIVFSVVLMHCEMVKSFLQWLWISDEFLDFFFSTHRKLWLIIHPAFVKTIAFDAKTEKSSTISFIRPKAA